MSTNKPLLSRIRIVLVQTYHPGNIGATARAMRTMGITDLHLINPREFPSDEATRMAAGATQVIEQATVHTTLEDAVADCIMVIGASARLRELSLPCFEEGDEMAKEAIMATQHGTVALVFGRERYGLTNEEISHCTHQLRFPTDESYGVLNLSQAVQIACYDLRNVWRHTEEDREDKSTTNMPVSFHSDEAQRPEASQLDYFDNLLIELLQPTGFLNQPHARTEEKLRAIFRRAQPNKRELSMLTGMIKALAQQQ